MKRFISVILVFLLGIASVIFPLSAWADSPNLIVNPSVETALNNQPSNWSTSSWGINTPTFSYAPTGHTGSHSLSVTVSGYKSGDAKWVPDKSTVTAGQTYNYSDYNQSTVPSELDAEYTDAGGNVTYAYLQTVNPSSTWQQTTSTFTVPSGVIAVAILHVIYSNGTLQTDDYSLTQASSATSTPPSNPTPPTQPTSSNLIANGSFETTNGTNPAGWNRGGYGTNTRTLSYNEAGPAHTGTGSATVSLSSLTNGDVKWYANPVPVTPGTAYTYQDYYLSTVATPVLVAMTDATGVDTYLSLSSAAAANSWTAFSASFTIPTGIKTVTIYHLLNQVGSLTLDDVSLVAGVISSPPTPPTPPTTPTSDNLVANPSFETPNGTNPAGWIQDSWGTNTPTFTYVKNSGHTGTASAKITMSNYTDGDAKWYFSPLTNLKQGAQYAYSIWYKTNAKISAVAMYVDGQGKSNYFNLPTPLVGASAATTWQQYKATFQVPTNATSMSIFFLIAGNGFLQIDDASVTPYTPVGFSEPLVSLTFDDGWSSIYDNAFPLLQKYSFVSTQYIISSYLDQPYYMTTQQIKTMQSAGNEIGSHTVTHPDLTTLSATNLNTELSQSQKTLQQVFGSSAALNIASPYGAYNQTVITAIKKYYQAHRSVDVGYNSKDNFNPYNIVVQNITTTTTPSDVASWVAWAKATNTWLVIVYHNVNATGVYDADTTSTANLDAELQIIKASGVSVKTMTQALTEVNSQL